jgi:hypothetical protein
VVGREEESEARSIGALEMFSKLCGENLGTRNPSGLAGTSRLELFGKPRRGEFISDIFATTTIRRLVEVTFKLYMLYDFHCATSFSEKRPRFLYLSHQAQNIT